MKITELGVLFLLVLLHESCLCSSMIDGPSRDEPMTELKWLKSQIKLTNERISVEQNKITKLTADLSTGTVRREAKMMERIANLTEMITNLTAVLSGEMNQGVRLREELMQLRSNQSKAEPVVAFSARVFVPEEQFRPKQVIVFGEVITNLGHGYNNTSGKFRCPISGLYQFYVAIMCKTNYAIHTDLMVNGVIRLYIFSSGSRNMRGSLGSNTVIIQLHKNDTVWVQVNNGDFVDGKYSTFAGHMLHAN